MLLIHGRYKFRRRPSGFRNGYCHHCEACTRHLQYRFFVVGHLFWIPILPLGFWREWRCSQCEHDPAPVMRRPFYWLLWIFLLLVGVSGWILPVDAARPAVSWLMRLGLPVVWLGLSYCLFRPRKPIQQCAPADEKSCPVCQAPMLRTSPPHCSSCGIKQWQM